MAARNRPTWRFSLNYTRTMPGPAAWEPAIFLVTVGWVATHPGIKQTKEKDKHE